MKRRTKKQQRQLNNGLKGLVLLLAAGTYFSSQDISLSIIIVFLVIIVILAISLFQIQHEKEKLRKSRIQDIDVMDGIKFEHYLKELFSAEGYEVEVTKATGDFGADLLLKKDGKKIVVQAKRSSRNVGIKAVQEVVAAKNYYDATDAWVASNNHYTNAAIELAKKSNVTLIDRDRLVNRILQMNPGALPTKETMKQQIQSKITLCERCGGTMIQRKGKRGLFYGCSNFPKCRNTKDFT